MMSKNNPASVEASQTLDDAFQKSPEQRLLERIVEQNDKIIELLEQAFPVDGAE